VVGGSLSLYIYIYIYTYIYSPGPTKQQEPDRGGATAFPGLDLLVQGKKGQALLFHYSGAPDTAPADPATWRAGGVTDNGLTTHTGCPVLEGRKLITAQWMRLGVTEQEPWSLYSSVGTALE